jgi:hypothetical protein
VRSIFGTRKTSLITMEIQDTEESTAVIEINTNWTKTESPSIPLKTNSCRPRTKTPKATSSQTKKSKEKEWPLLNKLQPKKTASQQRNQKLERALYLPSNPYTDVKLLPFPQPPARARTDARTNPSAQRATRLRSVLARVYAVSRQNQITTTVP